MLESILDEEETLIPAELSEHLARKLHWIWSLWFGHTLTSLSMESMSAWAEQAESPFVELPESVQVAFVARAMEMLEHIQYFGVVVSEGMTGESQNPDVEFWRRRYILSNAEVETMDDQLVCYGETISILDDEVLQWKTKFEQQSKRLEVVRDALLETCENSGDLESFTRSVLKTLDIQNPP